MSAIARSAARWLRADDERWSRVDRSSMPTAVVVVLFAALAIAFNRFGGTMFDAPRSFTRLVLVGVWGWLGLGVAIWAMGVVRARLSPADPPPVSALGLSIATSGLAHVPVLALGIVVFVFSGLMDVLGPGSVAAVFVFGLWFPMLLVAAARRVHGAGVAHALAVAAPPYAAWWLLVGSRLTDQIRHLL